MKAVLSADRDRSEPRSGEVMWAGVASALLFSVAVVLPPLLPVAIVSPFPLMMVRLRGSALWPAAMASLFAAALVGAVFSPDLGVSYFMVLALPGVAIAETMARGRGLVRGCVFAFTILAVEIGLALLFADGRMAEGALAGVQWLGSAQRIEEMRQSGWGADQIQLWKEQLDEYARVLSIVYPAVWLISGAMIVLANAVLLRWYLARKDPGWLDGGEVETIRWPLVLPVMFVIS